MGKFLLAMKISLPNLHFSLYKKSISSASSLTSLYKSKEEAFLKLHNAAFGKTKSNENAAITTWINDNRLKA